MARSMVTDGTVRKEVGASILVEEVRRGMNCYFCTEGDVTRPAFGICTDCGRAVCERHGAVETVRVSIRTGNMFEQRRAESRRLHCEACRALVAAR